MNEPRSQYRPASEIEAIMRRSCSHPLTIEKHRRASIELLLHYMPNFDEATLQRARRTIANLKR